MLLTHGGAEEVLARLSFPEVEIVGIFVETDIVRHHSFTQKIKRSIRYDGFAATASKLFQKVFARDKSGSELAVLQDSRNELERIAHERRIPFQLVHNYHDVEAIELMKACNPDLGVIYGTNIIKESVFNIPRLGSINLHQGLAPYYRGGPPIFWELYNGETEVGLTVHEVAAKVDSGAIILQQTVPLNYDYSYDGNYESFIEDFSKNLRPLCAELVARAVRSIALGTVETREQDSSQGTRYRLPVKNQKDELRRRLKARRSQSKERWTASNAET
jgi:methionyl-tRNA formyltransferase